MAWSGAQFSTYDRSKMFRDPETQFPSQRTWNNNNCPRVSSQKLNKRYLQNVLHTMYKPAFLEKFLCASSIALKTLHVLCWLNAIPISVGQKHYVSGNSQCSSNINSFSHTANPVVFVSTKIIPIFQMGKWRLSFSQLTCELSNEQ